MFRNVFKFIKVLILKNYMYSYSMVSLYWHFHFLELTQKAIEVKVTCIIYHINVPVKAISFRNIYQNAIKSRCFNVLRLWANIQLSIKHWTYKCNSLRCPSNKTIESAHSIINSFDVLMKWTGVVEYKSYFGTLWLLMYYCLSQIMIIFLLSNVSFFMKLLLKHYK